MRRALTVSLGWSLVCAAASLGCAASTAPPATAIDLPPPRPAGPPGGAAARQPPVAPVPVGMRRVQGEGFRYDVPDAWEVLDPASLGSDLIRSADRTRVQVGSFLTNVNVAAESFSGDGLAYAQANLSEVMKVAQIRGFRQTAAGDRAAADIESLWPNEDGVPYVTLQRYTTNGTRGFVLTCSAGAIVIDRERALCMRILDSFRVE